jgi:hypothetical protein
VPKLNALQIAERLRSQLEKLESGKEVAIRDLRALLTTQQTVQMDDAWQQQQVLREQLKAQTEEEQREQGWKTKREVQINAVQVALSEYSGNELEELNKLLQDKEVRQAKILLRAFSNAQDDGKEFWSAWTIANNQLVRARLSRVDGKRTKYMSKRDKEVREMEEQILAKIYSEMTVEEREQYDILNKKPKLDKKKRSK